MSRNRIEQRLAELHQGRKWVVAIDAAAGATELIKTLREWGAPDVMLVASTEGVGDLPEDIPIYYTRSRGPTVMKGFRAFFAALRDPSADLVEALDAFDSDHEALVILPPFGDLGREVVGRRVYGDRRPEWASLENKMLVDELWDSTGVERAPSEIVLVADAPAAATRLASGLGTVWVADNTEGWHGGGDYTRWVRGPDLHGEAVDWFAARARHVRVMPFLDGIPCSIHAYIASDGIATFRPVEIVILRRKDERGLVYGGVASIWDPPSGIRSEMRAAASAVATELQQRVDYRGPFGIDGVCTADGFRPTELNPRLSAGLGIQALKAELPLGTLTRAFLAGEIEVEAARLEEVIVTGADANRLGGMGVPVTLQIDPTSTGIRFVGTKAQPVDAEDDPDATMEVGPSSSGSFIRMRMEADRLDVGRSVAPYAASSVALAAELWSFDFPELEPAPDLCQRST
ncbi:MAG: hypothetical protein ACE5MI_04020 [Acidimicrobiia bacterium]